MYTWLRHTIHFRKDLCCDICSTISTRSPEIVILFSEPKIQTCSPICICTHEDYRTETSNQTWAANGKPVNSGALNTCIWGVRRFNTYLPLDISLSPLMKRAIFYSYCHLCYYYSLAEKALSPRVLPPLHSCRQKGKSCLFAIKGVDSEVDHNQ